MWIYHQLYWEMEPSLLEPGWPSLIVLSEEKRYFNYRHSHARMGAFGKLKSRFRVLHRKCESHKEKVKAMGLACIVLHNICIDPDLNKRRNRNELCDLLDLTNSRARNFEVGRSAGVKVEMLSLMHCGKKSKTYNFYFFIFDTYIP